MDNSSNNCTQFEQCERIAAVLSRNSQEATDLLARCLEKLYAAKCYDWLINVYAYKPVGLDAEHHAVQAFGDAVQVLFRRIREGQFQHDGKPYACRRFIHAVSRTAFRKLQYTAWKSEQRTMPREEPPEAAPADFEFPLEKDEKIENLHEAIKRLQQPYSGLLWMRYVEDLGIDDIAEKTGKTNQQVTKQLFEGRQKLRKLYNLD